MGGVCENSVNKRADFLHIVSVGITESLLYLVLIEAVIKEGNEAYLLVFVSLIRYGLHSSPNDEMPPKNIDNIIHDYKYFMYLSPNGNAGFDSHYS